MQIAPRLKPVSMDFDFVDHLRRRIAICAAVNRQERAGIFHHRHPHFDVTDAHAVVDSLAGTSFAIPRVDVRRAELELERCRHAVERLHPICLRRHSVRVNVNEAGRHDEAARVDRIAAAYCFFRDDGDSSVENADVATASRFVAGSITRPPRITRS